MMNDNGRFRHTPSRLRLRNKPRHQNTPYSLVTANVTLHTPAFAQATMIGSTDW